MWKSLWQFIICAWQRWFPPKKLEKPSWLGAVVQVGSLKDAAPHIKKGAMVLIGPSEKPK